VLPSFAQRASREGWDSTTHIGLCFLFRYLHSGRITGKPEVILPMAKNRQSSGLSNIRPEQV
jgi:hypothetical protein